MIEKKSCHLKEHHEPRGYDAKWNKWGRERQIPYDLTFIWNLKNKTNKTKHRQIHRYREQAGSYQKEGEWGRDKMGKGE